MNTPATPSRQPLRVALLGCGTVGSAVLRLLSEQSDDLAARVGRRIPPLVYRVVIVTVGVAAIVNLLR